MIRRFFALSSLAASMALPVAAGAEPASRAYNVEASLYDGDRLVGRPHVTVRAEKEVSVTVDQGYRLSMTITERVEASAVATVVKSKVEYWRDGRWTLVAAPVFTLGRDGSASIRTTPNERNPQAFRMDVRVRANN